MLATLRMTELLLSHPKVWTDVKGVVKSHKLCTKHNINYILIVSSKHHNASYRKDPFVLPAKKGNWSWYAYMWHVEN